MRQPNEILNTPPGDLEGWGSYTKGTGWSEKVYSGKAIREWILNKVNFHFDINEESLTPELGKKFIQKNKTVYIKDSSNNIITSFDTVVLELEDIPLLPIYKYLLTTVIPLSISLNSTSSRENKFSDLVGWDNWKSETDLYILIEKISGKNEISDYLDIKDIFGQSLLNDFSLVTLDIPNNILVIKQSGLKPLDDSDSNAIISFK